MGRRSAPSVPDAAAVPAGRRAGAATTASETDSTRPHRGALPSTTAQAPDREIPEAEVAPAEEGEAGEVVPAAEAERAAASDGRPKVRFL